MTVVNFAVALAVPRLTARLGRAVPLVVGVVLTLAGMLWLSRVGADSRYLTDVALPMLLIGAGQGLTFAPLTSAGIAGATARDAGAASGLVNTFHQLGMSLGLAVLVVAAGHADGAADGAGGGGAPALAAQVGAALTAGSVLLALALVAVVALIVPAGRTSGRAPGRARRTVDAG
jgi:hypothetical protein